MADSNLANTPDPFLPRPSFKFTEFQLRKFRRAFYLKDQGYFGKVRESDFVHWGKKGCQIAGTNWTAEKEATWKKVYHIYFGEANEITLDAWIMRCEMWNKSVTEEEYLDQSVEMNKLLFQTLDRNDDGYVSFREYLAFVAPLGITKVDAESCYYGFERKYKSRMTCEDFSRACINYYNDREPSPYQHFYGRFDDVDDMDFGNYPYEMEQDDFQKLVTPRVLEPLNPLKAEEVQIS